MIDVNAPSLTIVDSDGDAVTPEIGDYIAVVVGPEDERDVGQIVAIVDGELDIIFNGERAVMAPTNRYLHRRVQVFVNRAAAEAAAAGTEVV